MKAAILSLLALQMLANAQPVLAKAAASDPAGAQPIGSPGAWISTNDYPATALRYRMTGITFFRLTVDAAGVPSRCAITESSGFDVLDNATCQRIMEKARFSPARDRAGRPVEGAYANRVRWILPEGGTAPLERFPHELTRWGFTLRQRCDSDFLLVAGGQHGWHERFHRI